MNKYQFSKEEHLHLLNGKPLTGTSSVVNVLAKPLTWWSAELAAVECLEKGEKIETIRQEYEEAVVSGNKKQAIDKLQKKYPLFKKARFAHYDNLKKTAKKGTDLHELLERFVKSEMNKGTTITEEEEKLISPYIEWSRKNVKQYLASEAHCYDEELWVGGVTDAVAELNDGRIAVIDFKSSREAYPTHFIQASGYSIQINKNGLFSDTGINKKLEKPIDTLIIVPFGAKELAPVIKTNLGDYQAGFRHAVGLYRLLGLEKL